MSRLACAISLSLALLVAATGIGCRGNERASRITPDLATTPATMQTGRAIARAQLAVAGPATPAEHVSGGCGDTSVFRGGVPSWLDDAGAHNNPSLLPYAVATPPTAAGFLFGYPLRAGQPENPANKILWVVRTPRRGSALSIEGHPLDAPSPLVHQSRPADSGPGEIYPSIVDVPSAGCWHFTLKWAGGRADLDLEYQIP